MRNGLISQITHAVIWLVIFSAPALAQDDKKVAGELEAGGIIGSGQEDSAKFDEYSDRSNGAFGNLELNCADISTDEYVNLGSWNIARDDQKSEITGGKYGEYRIGITYDQIPHRFYNGGQTLYGGNDGQYLELPDSLQSSLQDSASMTEAADRLSASLTAGSIYDLRTMRKKGKAGILYQGFDPFTVRLEVSNEIRNGNQRIMESFGFGNVQELVESVDYETTDLKLSAEYAAEGLVFNTSYFLSAFNNGAGSLMWDNPFRLTDSTSPAAYTNPSFNPAPGVFSNLGPSKGLMDLAPDNIYHGPSIMGSISDLPMDSRLTMNGAWGFMSQDDDLLPYTTNTAIIGVAEDGGEFDASDPNSLPVSSIDNSVMTQLYNVVWSGRPINWMDFKARYRYYGYDNNTDEEEFPGYVRFDAVWEEIPWSTQLSGYSRQTAGADLGLKVMDDTRVGLEYSWEGTHRDNREVENQADNMLGASVDQKPADWINVRTSYEKSFRDVGSYNFAEPFGEEPMPPQIPWLRKYDEADRETDRVNFLANMNPIENLAFTGNFIYGQSDYDESLFGLLDDRFYMLSGDVDWTAADWAQFTAFYSYEQHDARQKDRQWNPGGLGDPYITEPDYDSYSNWDASSEDRVHTVGGGVTFTLCPKTLYFDVNYAYTNASGDVTFYSALGAPDEMGAATDANTFLPTPWTMVDQTILQRVNPKVRYRLDKNWNLTVGYLWEKFKFNDFTGSGYMAVPTNAAGEYNGAMLSGTWPFEDYEVSLAYAGVKYKF